MHPAFRQLPAALLALASVSSFAATTVYTSSASFLSAAPAGSYTETFTGMSDPAGAATFSGGGVSYSAASGGNLYLEANYLSTSLPNFALTLTFTSGNVRAVGGNFYVTNFSDFFQPAAVTLSLSDGTTVSFTPTSMTDSYRGFISTTPITSLTFSAPGVSLYAGIDNLTVGAVPEPSSWLLLALGGTGLLVATRKRSNA